MSRSQNAKLELCRFNIKHKQLLLVHLSSPSHFHSGVIQLVIPQTAQVNLLDHGVLFCRMSSCCCCRRLVSVLLPHVPQ